MELNLKEKIKRFNILLILVLLVFVSSILSPNFLEINNLLNVVRQASLLGLIAFGMTLIIISGGIDLSVGSMVAVASVLSSTLIQDHNVLYAVIVSLTVTTLIGIINGIIITKGKLQPFLVTLAMMVTARGFSQIYAKGMLIEIFNESFLSIGRGHFIGIPIPVIILAIAFLLIYFIMNRTVLGISIFAIGGNSKASYLSGLSVNTIKTILYGISGLLSGIAGLIYTSRLGAGYGMAGMQYELEAIAAVVMGGTLMSGGSGKVTGTLAGVLIIAVLKTILNMLNVPAPYHLILQAAIIIGAVITHRKIK